MAASIKASEKGLQIIEVARKKRGWIKNATAWRNAAGNLSGSTLNRFWAQTPISQENFVAICKAVGEDWERIADLPTLTPARALLSQDIQKDCKLLQELLDHNDQSYLPEKWQSCLSKNRDILQDISSRILLSQSIRDALIQSIQNFYKQLDSIEEKCKKLLELQLKTHLFELKPNYGNGILTFGTIHQPASHKQYFTEKDALDLLSIKALNSMRLKNLKEKIQAALHSGNQIVCQLN
jgi:hypothetical protein